MRSLNPYIFRRNSALRKLDISGNKITHVDNNTFYNNTKLYYFNLSYNEINSLDPGMFLNNTNLRILDLSHNNLTFKNNIPILIAPKLSHLFLEFCNIGYLPVLAFQNLTMLQDLRLNNNRLETLEGDPKRHPLKYHSMAGLPTHLLYGLRSLEILDISNNKLRSLNINLVIGHDNLKWLNISGNPVYCDCKLQELWRWCFESYPKTHTASCDKPDTCSWEFVRSLSCDVTNRSTSGLLTVTALIAVTVVVLVIVAIICRVVPKYVLQELWSGFVYRTVTFFCEPLNAAFSSCSAYLNTSAHRRTCSKLPTSDDL
jgi:hypothetical protein